jgi:phi LC3 family holin
VIFGATPPHLFVIAKRHVRWLQVALAIVDGVFILLALLGIIPDPTTAGMSDSDQAMTYTEPKK